MSYEIHVKQIPPANVVVERKHTTLAKLGEEMRSTLAAIAGSVDPAGAARGVPFVIYGSAPTMAEGAIDVELGLPVAPDARVDETGQVHRRQLDGGAVAYTIHTGPYRSVGGAYAALYEWIARHGHKPLGPPRELYVVGPAQGVASSDYRTEIEIPID